jgi:hypothetical protein
LRPFHLECFRIATFPAIKVGTTIRITCQNGKFQGIIPTTIPRVQRIFSVLYEWGSISSTTPIATPTPTFSELTWALPNRDEDDNAVRPRMDTHHP